MSFLEEELIAVTEATIPLEVEAEPMPRGFLRADLSGTALIEGSLAGIVVMIRVLCPGA